MKYSIFFAAFGLNLQAQNRVSETILKTRIYIQRIFGLCQKFHPLVKANLEINKAQASLMAARVRSKLRLTLIKAIQGHRILFDFK
jgi:hypothetical protein